MTMKLIYYNYPGLLKIRDEIQARSPKRLPAWQKLLQQAGALLAAPPASVIEGDLPPSGDAHDFFAIGKYAWPNPGTSDGMPWIRRDCAVNTEAYGDKYDLARYSQTVVSINTLSLAWFHSRDEKYAQKACALLHVWFLDPETKMNPNFNCASALPGVCAGMPVGIIFGVILIEMLDHVKLLGTSKIWTPADDDSLKRWFSDYCTWLLGSDFGKTESAMKNNHGSWHAAQVAACSLYSGDLNRARSMIGVAKKHVGSQIAGDGSLPNETRRDWSFHYSLYGLSALTVLARCAGYIGEDLWSYRAPNGRTLKAAFDFFIPHASGQKKWEYKNTEADESVALNIFPTVRRAADAYDSPEFREADNILMQNSPPDSIDAWLMD